MKLTADTITDSQIRELLDHATHDRYAPNAAKAVARTCRIALDDGVTHRTKTQLREARARCAVIWNNLHDQT